MDGGLLPLQSKIVGEAILQGREMKRIWVFLSNCECVFELKPPKNF